MPRRIAALVAAVTVALGACGGSPEETEAVTERRPADDSTVSVHGLDVFSVERDSVHPDPSLPTVLFLHGASFTTQVWVDTNILDDVAASGYRAVAVDLPGFGRTPASAHDDRGAFLADLIAALDEGGGVVVVSPSMSGSFSLPMIAADGGRSLVGFVPVAPVGIADFVAGTAPIGSLPTRIVWGANDDVIAVDGAKQLASVLTDSSIIVIEGAGHAAYRDEPEQFVEALVGLLDSNWPISADRG